MQCLTDSLTLSEKTYAKGPQFKPISDFYTCYEPFQMFELLENVTLKSN